MILYAINYYTAPVSSKKDDQPKDKFVGQHGSIEHKQFILERAFTNCKFKCGEDVIYRKKPYKVNLILGPEYFDYIDWAGLAPLFIEICTSDGKFKYVNSGNLTRPRWR